jgi:hypothetical protein
MGPNRQQQVSPCARTVRTTPPPAHLSALPPRLPSRKTYHGHHARNGCAEVWVEEFRPVARQRRGASTVCALPLHLDLRSHSPTGFAWGYSGSGPAQLALALLMDATGDEELALAHYQEFKRQQVAGWPDEWSMTVEAIQAFVAGEEQRSPLERTSFPHS